MGDVPVGPLRLGQLQQARFFQCRIEPRQRHRGVEEHVDGVHQLARARRLEQREPAAAVKPRPGRQHVQVVQKRIRQPVRQRVADPTALRRLAFRNLQRLAPLQRPCPQLLPAAQHIRRHLGGVCVSGLIHVAEVSLRHVPREHHRHMLSFARRQLEPNCQRAGKLDAFALHRAAISRGDPAVARELLPRLYVLVGEGQVERIGGLQVP